MSATPPATPPPNNAPAFPPPGRRSLGDRPMAVGVMIAAALLLTLATLALIYRGWFRSSFPTACIQLNPATGESVEGAVVTVSNIEQQEVARVTLDKDPAPVLVAAGVYSVSTRFEGQTRTQQVVVPHRRIVYVPITTRPAGRAGEPGY